MSNKITIIGAGQVGSTIAFALTLKQLASEIVIIDIVKDKAMGEAMDIRQGTPYMSPVNIHEGTYEDAKGSNIVIVTSGAARKPGQTRLDLAQTNVNIFKSIIPQITRVAPDAIYVLVANPVDILTYQLAKTSSIPVNRIIGTGTLLDTARLRTKIADEYGIGQANLHAYVFGEHGDSSFIPWSLTSIAGVTMEEYCEDQAHADIDEEEIIQEVRSAGAEVIKRKGATFYAIAMSVNKICDSILRDSKNIITVSTLINDKYGINDVCLSLPCVIGSNGIEKEVSPSMTDEEMEKLRNSAAALRSVLDQIVF